MIHYATMPDGLDSSQLRPYIEAVLAEAEQAAAPPVVDTVSQLYDLSLCQVDTYEAPDQDLKERIMSYAQAHMDFEDPRIVLPMAVMSYGFELDALRSIIREAYPIIRNQEVKELLVRYEIVESQVSEE